MFELPEGARVPRPARPGRTKTSQGVPIVTVPMPEPLIPSRPEPRQPDGPCLAGMEEVGTGILDHVDAMQRVAASAPPDPLLINAGPGTGKTHVLVRRIAYLTAELHVPASQCLVLARDGVAVEDLTVKLRELVGSAVDDMTVMAFDDVTRLPPLGYLFVDDLHHMPTRLYESLRTGRGNQPAFTATGDPDSLAHGTPLPFERFARDYPEARMVRLSRNHRSTAPIIAAAMQLITPVTRAPGRGMLPSRSADGTAAVGRFYAADAAAERHFAERLPGRLAEYGVDPGDVAIIAGDDRSPITAAVSVDEVAGRQYRVVCCVGVTAESFPDEPEARRRLFIAMTRAADLLYVSHPASGSPLLDDIDPGLFTAFGQVRSTTPHVEQPRLL